MFIKSDYGSHHSLWVEYSVQVIVKITDGDLEVRKCGNIAGDINSQTKKIAPNSQEPGLYDGT